MIDGLTRYPSEAEKRETLANIQQYKVSGSRLIINFSGHRMIECGQRRTTRKPLEETDEALKFGLDVTTDPERFMRTLVESNGYEMGDVTFLGKDGRKGAFVAVIEMLVLSAWPSPGQAG